MQATPPVTARAANESSQCFQVTVDGYPPLYNLWVLGSTVIGSNASWMLLGFLTAQTYTYYTRSAMDGPMLKILVYSLVFLAAVGETAVEGYVAFTYLVSGWGNPHVEEDNFVPLEVQENIQPVFNAIPAIAVQLFFTWRIWKFCQAVWGRKAKRFVVALCTLIILVSICAFASAITLFVNEMTAEVNGRSTVIPFLVWTISTAVVDVTITACMMVVLHRAKSSAYNGETRDKISHMLRLTIETGFLTSILAILITPLLFSGKEGWNTFPCYFLGKSYVMTLLANLNGRSSYQPKLEPVTGIDVPIVSTVAFKAPGQNSTASRTDTSSGHRMMSLIRSAAHTVHSAFRQGSSI